MLNLMCFLFVYSTPLALIPLFAWATVPISVVVVFVFYGMLEVAHALSDPFGNKSTDFQLVYYGIELHDELLCIARRVDAAAQPLM